LILDGLPWEAFGIMLRISSGVFRGRMIHAPTGEQTRPSSSRLRQAWLNSIQMRLSEAAVLDLFSGSGALAIEALSRGAERAVCVENSKKALPVLKKNLQALQIDSQIRVVAEDVSRCFTLVERFGPFDLIFADPPYSEEWELRLLQTTPWLKLLKPGGLFVLEWGRVKSKVDSLPHEILLGSTHRLVQVREKDYGDSVLTSFELETLEG
jgi:16S rRNA (guanine966-N2)-methyltransferase